MPKFTIEYDGVIKEYELDIFGLSIWFDEIKLEGDILNFLMKGVIICVFLPDENLRNAIDEAYIDAILEV